MRNIGIVFAAALALAACNRSSSGEKSGGMSMGGAPADKAPGSGSMAMAGSASGPMLPEGHAEVTISPDRQQLIGLKTARAEQAPIEGEVRATAIIQADEKKEAHVHPRLMGWVRQLYVNAVGQKVSVGQPLYAIYSQDLLVAEQEYLRARTFNADLASAARDRLRLWEIPDDQIAELERTGKPLEQVVVRSPITGTVIEKSIVKGMYVGPEMALYRIADLSHVWVIAEVYEYELGRVDRSAIATVKIEGIDEPLKAPIDYVYPTVDPTSRTVKVRLVLDNKRGALRPGNFATVELPTTAVPVITVPDEAVVDTGVRTLVYRALGDGRFRPVEVEVGRRVGGRAEIRKGLQAGDEVVVSAQFLVDSESRLRASSNPMGGM